VDHNLAQPAQAFVFCLHHPHTPPPFHDGAFGGGGLVLRGQVPDRRAVLHFLIFTAKAAEQETKHGHPSRCPHAFPLVCRSPLDGGRAGRSSANDATCGCCGKAAGVGKWKGHGVVVYVSVRGLSQAGRARQEKGCEQGKKNKK